MDLLRTFWRNTERNHVLDTNVLLDWLLERSETRTKKIRRLFSNNRQFVIPDLVVVELAWVLEKHYRFPREAVLINLAKVLDEPLFNCHRTLFSRALVDYADHSALSFLDACLIHYAELQDNLPLWTFDQKLVTQSGGRARLIK